MKNVTNTDSCPSSWLTRREVRSFLSLPNCLLRSVTWPLNFQWDILRTVCVFLMNTVDSFHGAFVDAGYPFLVLGDRVLLMDGFLIDYCSYRIFRDDIIDFCLADKQICLIFFLL